MPQAERSPAIEIDKRPPPSDRLELELRLFIWALKVDDL